MKVDIDWWSDINFSRYLDSSSSKYVDYLTEYTCIHALKNFLKNKIL